MKYADYKVNTEAHQKLRVGQRHKVFTVDSNDNIIVGGIATLIRRASDFTLNHWVVEFDGNDEEFMRLVL
jgi:hypothetical protein